MNKPIAVSHLASLILNGDLLPIGVFGGPDVCPHCGKRTQWSYGLCDDFSQHSPAGSDCNRAAEFMLRPSNALMDSVEVREALKFVREHEDAQP